MKKLLAVVFIMILLAVSPLLAAFCQNCGKEMPEAANFCAVCGKAAAGAFQTAQPAQPSQSNNLAVPSNSPVVISAAPDDGSLADYDSINQIELLLTNTNYAVASRQAKELRRQHDQRMVVVERNYRHFSPYRRKLHDLNIQKLKALDTYLEAWKGTEYGQDRVRSMAEKDKALFVLSQTNEAIDTLLTGGSDLYSIAKVEEMERRLQRTSGNFVITAPYIQIDNQRLNRGEPIWVIDVVSASAKVLHMGRGRSSQPICGWVSVYDLERRSNWRSDPAFFYSPPVTTTIVYEPAPEPPVKVVIVSKGRYPYRHDRDRHDDRRDRDRDRHDGRNDRHGDHRGHDYLVINPRFW